MAFKIKIRGDRASVTRFSEIPVTELMAKQYIDAIRGKFRNQINSCLVFTNDGKMVENFSYLLPKKKASSR